MKKKLLTLVGAVFVISGSGLSAAPFGGAEDAEYAAKLWSAMIGQGLVGAEGVMSTPYTGVHPHGAILDTLDTRATVDGKANIVLIKRNYGGEGVSKQAVANDPAKWLEAVTVMYKRPGYDPESKDWFWVKYAPDGSLLKNPKGVPLAGRIAKGMTTGCIACHTAAPGGDFVFNHDRYKE